MKYSMLASAAKAVANLSLPLSPIPYWMVERVRGEREGEGRAGYKTVLILIITSVEDAVGFH